MNTQAPHQQFDVNGPGGSAAAAPEEREANFAEVLRVFWSAVYRARLVMLAIVAVSMIAGLIVTMLMTPKYRATATVQIDQQASKVLASDTNVDPVEAIQDADRFLQTQVDILTSRSLEIRVMQGLNLLANDNFVERMRYTVVSDPVGALNLADTKREQVLKILDDNLSVSLPRNSRVVQIGFKSPDPVLAAQVANAFARYFQMSNLQRKFDTSAYARSFLGEQLAATKQRLEDSERAMVAYAREAGLIDASAGVGATADPNAPVSGPRSLVTSNLVQLNGAYSQARAIRVEAEERWAQAMKAPLMTLPEVLSNPAVLQLTQARSMAQAAYEQEGQRHRPDYPTMQQAAAQIAGLDQQINALATSVRNSLRDQYLTALKQEQGLSGNVNALKLDTLSEQDRSIRYNILKRETDSNRTMYDGLLQRFEEVSAAAGLTANNVSLVDTADVPAKPVSPRILLNLALSMLLGFAAATVFVLVRENFDDAVRSPDDVTRKLGIVSLASVPLLPAGEVPLEAFQDPRSPLSEAYTTLRTSLELVDTGGLPPTLLVTSSRQSEGKSTSAYAIARSFAKLNRQVLLIDGDLRKPSLHRSIGATNVAGLSSLLARHKTIEEVIQLTAEPNLSLISSGPLPPNPAELLSGAALPTLLRELSTHFDLIVVDGPPVLGLADAVLLANNTAGTIFVIEANKSNHGHAKAAIRRLSASGAHILGAVLTKYDSRKVGYGQEYGYSYYAYTYGADSDAKSSRAG